MQVGDVVRYKGQYKPDMERFSLMVIIDTHMHTVKCRCIASGYTVWFDVASLEIIC